MDICISNRLKLLCVKLERVFTHGSVYPLLPVLESEDL